MTGPGSHRTSKVVSLDEAIGLVHKGATLGVGGAGGVQEPDALLEHLAKTYKASGAPGGLTEFHAIRTGELDGRGTSLFGAKGFVNKMVGGSFWPVGTPELIRRILNNEIAAYNFSIGAIYAMLEATAAGRPGFVTTVGLDTFVDPLQQGGALNASAAAAPMVERVEIGGQPLLYYHAPKIDIAFLRGSRADPDGNITMEYEPAVCGALLLAQASRASGGKVVVQVKEVVERGALTAHHVRLPGVLVDAVVVSPDQRQITHVDFDPTLVGMETFPLEDIPRPEMGPDKIIMRRAMLEARPGDVLAIGFGIPGFLPAIAVEEDVLDDVTFVIEHGVVGGVNGYACGGKTFPCAHNPVAIVDAADQLRFFSGGGLDRAYLGVGEVDSAGNVNVSRFGERIPGAGGFIDMTQGTRDVVFCVRLGDRPARKFVPQVQQVTFSGKRAQAMGQNITYVTERAVFRLRKTGLVMTEIAPGIDPCALRDEIGADARIADDLQPMPVACFAPEPMKLSQIWKEGKST